MLWFKLVQWFWRWRFLKFINTFSQFCNYLPLEKGGAFWTNLNTLHPRMFWSKFGWNKPSGSGEENVKWKFTTTTTTTTTTTDNGQISIRKAHLSLRPRWTNNKFLMRWNPKPNTLKINHFIIKNKILGTVIQHNRRWVPRRSAASLFFNVTLYSLTHFWLDTQK